MSDRVNLTVVRSDDWDAIYCDGVLAYSGSENLVREVLSLVTGKTIGVCRYGYVEEGTPAGAYLAEHGDYPEGLTTLEALGEELR